MLPFEVDYRTRKKSVTNVKHLVEPKSFFGCKGVEKRIAARLQPLTENRKKTNVKILSEKMQK